MRGLQIMSAAWVLWDLQPAFAFPVLSKSPTDTRRWPRRIYQWCESCSANRCIQHNLLSGHEKQDARAYSFIEWKTKLIFEWDLIGGREEAILIFWDLQSDKKTISQINDSKNTSKLLQTVLVVKWQKVHSGAFKEWGQQRGCRNMFVLTFACGLTIDFSAWTKFSFLWNSEILQRSWRIVISKCAFC